MTAQRAEQLPSAGEPVPYVLTPLGEAATRELMTSDEAAALLRVTTVRITQLARGGRIVGVMVNRRWFLEGDSVRAYRADPRAPSPQVPAQRRQASSGPVASPVPAEPFLRLLDGRGGAAACGVRQHSPEEKAIERARHTRQLTEEMADRLSVHLLGLTPWEVWGWPDDDSDGLQH